MSLSKTAFAFLSVIFASAAQATPLDDLARDVGTLAHAVIRDAQSLGRDHEQRISRVRDLIRQDPTILYGNHSGMLSQWGADSNVVLARHHTIPQRLQSCSNATDAALNSNEKIDLLTNCIGNLRDMNQFGIVTVDQDRLDAFRKRLQGLKPPSV